MIYKKHANGMIWGQSKKVNTLASQMWNIETNLNLNIMIRGLMELGRCYPSLKRMMVKNIIIQVLLHSMPTVVASVPSFFRLLTILSNIKWVQMEEC